MPSSSYKTTKIVLSGPKNFQLWMLRLPGALAKEKVLGVVTGVDLPPTTTTSTTRIIMAWIDDQLALRLESEGLAPLSPMATSRKMYEKLIEIHRKVNVSIKVFYNFVELVGLQWDGISSIEEHLTSLKKTYRRLLPHDAPPPIAPHDSQLGNVQILSIELTPFWYRSIVFHSQKPYHR
ncbi:hypothetical protein K439DRAFT_1638811 [Ramaria rubella]|nr:hypothetical protein K439DRAFT_1638811 [Ramaria rubella]